MYRRVNKFKNKNWENKLKQYKLDPTLEWHFAEIIEIDPKGIIFKTLNEKQKEIKGRLKIENIYAGIKKEISVRKVQCGRYSFGKRQRLACLQPPKVNGGVVVINPFNGDVKALVGVLILNRVNLIESHKQKDNQVQLSNHSLRRSIRKWIFSQLNYFRCTICGRLKELV